MVLSPLITFPQGDNDGAASKGQPHFKVFWNYHYDYTENTEQVSAFELTRVYLGYKYKFDNKFSAKITYDIGKNDAGSNHTALVKIAQLDYKINPSVKISMGLIAGKQYKDQENHWGYRYIYKMLQDENRFGPSADLGINAEFKISKTLMANLFIVNGEGYKNPQDDNGDFAIYVRLLYGEGTLNANNGFNVGLVLNNHADDQLVALFGGWAKDKIRTGLEYNRMDSSSDSYVMLANYLNYSLSDKLDVFIRNDRLEEVGGDTSTDTYLGTIWKAHQNFHIAPSFTISDGDNDFRVSCMFKY